MGDDVLISVEGVSKRFAKRLRHAMWYGACDLSRAVAGLKPRGEELRPSEFWSLRDVSFEVKRGECLGVIGPNGAGKSTLLKLINGILRPDAGRLRVRGRVGALIEVGAGFHPLLTGRENIYVNGSILGMSRAEIARKFDAIVEFADIGDFLDTPVKFYSSGMHVRLGFAVAAHLEPDVLLVDEVLAVGDLAFRVKCYRAIAGMLERCAVVLVSHSLPHVHRSSTRALVLSRGKVRFQGAVGEAVAAYEEMQGAGEKPAEYSTGRAHITRMELRKGSAPCSVVRHGDGLRAYLDCAISDQVPSFNVILHFHNRGGEAVAEVNSLRDRKSIPNPGHPFRLAVEMGQVFLAPGYYSVSAILLGGDNPCDHLCVLQYGSQLRVEGGCVTNAPLLFPATFEVQAAER
jgi:lipopolysaccharide transport system ATP-binding protein